MSIIEITNFSQNYGDKPLYVNANFVLNNNEKIGITGLNGAGKSTLIKILMGSVLLDEGKMFISNKHKIEYLDQHAEINQDCSIRDYLAGAFANLYNIEKKYNEVNEKMAVETNSNKLEKLFEQSANYFEILDSNNFYSLDSNIDKVSAGLGVNALGMDTNVSTLSGGQRAKVMLAKLLLSNPDVMILDEPTNFLDVSHIDWLSKFIKSSDKAYVIVSHDEKFINSVVTHICDVENGVITKYFGDLNKVRAIKESKAVLQGKQYVNQQKEIKKLEDYIARNKARAATAKMARSRERKLDKMDIINPPKELVKPTFSFKQKEYIGNLMLKVENLEVGYNGKSLLKTPLNFELCKGDRIAIVGFNGIGKSTLLKTLLNKIPAVKGKFIYSRNTIAGYYEQENNFKTFEGTPITYIKNIFPQISERENRAALFRCGLNQEHLRHQVKQLSGGEQSKMKLCELTIAPSNILLLDEPTNHLDFLAIERLEEAMKEYTGAILFVSHNKEFVRNLATKVIDLEKGL